jgi:hypothetical protein
MPPKAQELELSLSSLEPIELLLGAPCDIGNIDTGVFSPVHAMAHGFSIDFNRLESSRARLHS